MKLYEVPRGSRIKLAAEHAEEHPPAHREFEDAEELEFSHVDGMYSLCFDKDGRPVHLKAWADVEILREGPPQS